MADSNRRVWLSKAGMVLGTASVGAEAQVDVRQYQAVGDGHTVNTVAIQKAIDNCSAAGGGKVILERGSYVTGTLFLKSNVTLYVEAGAAILGSTNIADYATGTHRNMYAHESHMDRCLIFARDADNIGLEGKGVIDGQGTHFPNAGDSRKNRPMMVRFVNCKNIFVKDITLRNPAAWTSALLYCSDIRVDGISVDSRANNNGDGMDFDGCQNVRVSNSRFNNSDDSICLQTSERDKPVQNVVITNCIMTSKWAAIRIGLLSRGDFYDIAVSNCVFHDIVGEGLKIQMNEGGRMNNLLFSNIIMRNVPRPVFVTFNSFPVRVDAPGPPPEMQSLRNLMFSNIRIEADAASAESRFSSLAILGLPGHPVENVTFDNIHFTAPGGGTEQDATRRDVPELAGIRPEHNALGQALPSFGLYARHVRGLTVTDVTLDTSERDLRPGLLCDDAESVRLSGVRVKGDSQAGCLVHFRDTRDAVLQNSAPLSDCKVFLKVEGRQSAGIALLGNDLRRVHKAVDIGLDAPGDSVNIGSNLMST